jgi:hypothetical protein
MRPDFWLVLVLCLSDQGSMAAPDMGKEEEMEMASTDQAENQQLGSTGRLGQRGSLQAANPGATGQLSLTATAPISLTAEVDALCDFVEIPSS